MGWAKYYEDINDLITERIMLIDRSNIDAEIENTVHFDVPKTVIRLNHDKEDYSDISIVCRDCGRMFWFSAKSQKYFKEHGWSNPKRCKRCREHRSTVFLMLSSH